MELGADDIHSLQHALVEEDESVRARAHLELGRIALTMARTEAAARHLREALALDERLHEARALLNDLERRAVAAVPAGSRSPGARAPPPAPRPSRSAPRAGERARCAAPRCVCGARPR